MFFDKSTFLNHFSSQHTPNTAPESYARIVTDPMGIRWGYLARENVYECMNTRRRMTPLMLENYILEQTEVGLGVGDYSTEAGHGRSDVDRSSLVPRDAFVYGSYRTRGKMIAQSNAYVYKQRANNDEASTNTAQDLIAGAEFTNSTLIPTVGHFTVYNTGSARGIYIISSVDSEEGVTMEAETGYSDTLFQYLSAGETWANLGRGGTGAELTVLVGGSCDVGLSAGDVLVYTWNVEAGSPALGARGTQIRYYATAIDQITRNGVVQGVDGATWPSQNLSAGGTAYWGITVEFNMAIGTPGSTMTTLNTTFVAEDMSKV